MARARIQSAQPSIDTASFITSRSGGSAPQGAPTRLESTSEQRAADKVASEIIAGLLAPTAMVSPKYFYDTRGSHLFEMITALPEYYLTRTEKAIMARYATEIAASAGTGSTLIDLGAGNCEKARNLFAGLRPIQYVAVDISAEFLRKALGGLRPAFPAIEILGVCADVSCGLTLPDSVRRQRRLFHYPGSSIGNFVPQDALALLSQIREQCDGNGGLLIGVDLVKSDSILEPAYNDVRGITAAFNLNLLRNLNELIGSDFRVEDWRHRAFFNAGLSRVEMHLEAKHDVRVDWREGGRVFLKGECIHTENSYKYALPDFRDLLARAGFRRVRAWTDERQWFAVCHAAV